MINKMTHILRITARRISPLIRDMVILCIIFLFFRNGTLSGQVISNTGASISVTPGIVIGSEYLENSSGLLDNDGTINLSGDFSNSGTTSGDGSFNLAGDWTDLGVFNPGMSSVNLLGTTDQTIIHGSTGEVFYILTVDNPGNTITQTADAGSSLRILNNFNLTDGTVRLGPTTSSFTVGGKATIEGTLLYDNITPQTASVTDILSGTGTIDMSGGSLPHILNLAGATNDIGTFITSPAGASIVDYNGTSQTVFPASNYRNLIISNSGIKSLQGNSTVGIDLTISGGTFNLGATTTVLDIYGDALIAGSLSFSGTSVKTVSLTGDLSGAGSIDMSGGNLSHILNLAGSSNDIGAYSSGDNSLVNYLRNGEQTIFTSDDYRHLTISGTGVKTLMSDITAKGVLTMSGGDIDAGGNTLKVSNSDIGAIVRSSGTVIGRLQRAIGITGSDYLYPIGSSAYYNPLKMTFQELVSGALTARFIPEDIGNAGLPLDDDGNEIYDVYPEGYWSLTAVSPMSTGSYSVNLNYEGFTGIDLSASIIKRTDEGDLELDGEHGSVTGTEITRTVLVNGISPVTTDLAIGRGRPRITQQPENIDICEWSDAFFEVKARGRGNLTYQWQISYGGSFINISDVGVYSGTGTSKLIITGAPYSMNGYVYRCIVTDAQGNSNITDTALLTVNKIPVATATPAAQDACPGVPFTDIVLGTSNDVPGTTFSWVRDDPAGITTTLPLSGMASNDRITGIFTNTTDAPVTVTFTITPTGPPTTYCVGSPITVTVTVNPTPRVFATPVETIQCDSTTTNILLTSPSTFTSGFITFRYTVSSTGAVSGYSSSVSGLSNNHIIEDNLANLTDHYQTVTYRIVPVSPVGCAEGPAQEVTVTVNPTPRVIPVNLKPSICFGDTTQVLLTTPTVMTSGVIRFDYDVSVTGGPGVVVGSTASMTDLSPGYVISLPYENNSDTLQSVFYSITPKVTGLACSQGNVNTQEVLVHPIPLQDLLMPKTLTCEGGSDAILTAVLAKGTSPHYVEWSGFFGYHLEYTTDEDSTDVTNLTGGIYYITVTDNLGCQSSDNIFISGARLDENMLVIQKPNGYGTTCPDSEDGELWIRESTVSTGIPPFEYWIVYNNQDTVMHDTLFTKGVFHKYYDLPTGNYRLIIKDVNGCYNTDPPSLNIVPPDEIDVVFTRKEYDGGYNISCSGYSDGSVWVESIGGGNGGYTYKWSTINGTITGDDTVDRLDNITAGTYYLTVTDFYGCVKVDSVTLYQPEGMELTNSELSVSTDGNTNISCHGGNDGFINITISGGSGDYLYSWSSPNGFSATTQNITGLKAGDYTCVVTDVNGCVLTPLPTFTLTEPDLLEISSTTSVSVDGSYDINCYGGTGWIDLTVTGGSIGTYIYNWTTEDGSGIVEGDEDQYLLTAGTYHIEVTDSNGCVTTGDITLTQPPEMNLQLSGTDITCQAPDFDNGAVDLSVSGGAGPYTYDWSNGSVNEDISDLTEGYYTVIVTYNNSCTKSDSVRINLPPPLEYTKTVSDHNGYNISCYGMGDGSVEIEPTSGLAPFIYSWTGPDGFVSTAKDITGLKAGNYTLLITDSNYCTAMEEMTLTEPGELDMIVSLSTSIAGGYNINCAGDSTGYIGIEPVNYVQSVSYLWSDGSEERTRTDLPAGEYSVVITDANNCQAGSVITLTEPDSLKLFFNVKEPFCPDMPDGEIDLDITGGVMGAGYYYQWSDNSTDEKLTGILPGFYKVVVSDMNSCSVTDSVNVESLNESCLIIPNAFSPNDDLINDVWIIGMIELYPKMEIRIFNRWGETVWRSEEGYPQPWDGRSNGIDLPTDSYHYIINLHNGTKPMIGNITIVR